MTLEGLNGAQDKITSTPKGIEFTRDDNDIRMLLHGGKLELRTHVTITKMDLIRLEIVNQEK